MYTGGISDTQQGYKPIVKNSSVKNYQADFVFFLILIVFGVMFIGAGVLLLQKQKKRATDKADPGAAIKESTAAVAEIGSDLGTTVTGAVKNTGNLFGSATNAAGKLTESAANATGTLLESGADVVKSGAKIIEDTTTAGRR